MYPLNCLLVKMEKNQSHHLLILMKIKKVTQKGQIKVHPIKVHPIIVKIVYKNN